MISDRKWEKKNEQMDSLLFGSDPFYFRFGITIWSLLKIDDLITTLGVLHEKINEAETFLTEEDFLRPLNGNHLKIMFYRSLNLF